MSKPGQLNDRQPFVPLKMIALMINANPQANEARIPPIRNIATTSGNPGIEFKAIEQIVNADRLIPTGRTGKTRVPSLSTGDQANMRLNLKNNVSDTAKINRAR